MRPACIKVATQMAVVVWLAVNPHAPGRCESMSPAIQTQTIQLPAVRTDGDISVEQALQTRRSVRSY